MGPSRSLISFGGRRITLLVPSWLWHESLHMWFWCAHESRWAQLPTPPSWSTHLMLWFIMGNIHIWSSFSFLAKLSLISWSFLSSESYESVFCFVKGQNLRMEAVVSGANLIIKVLKLPVPPTSSTYWEERGVVDWLQTPMAKHCQLCLWKAASVKNQKVKVWKDSR